MAQQTINVGAAPNDGTGTPLRTAFQYTNSNFTELYTALGGGSGLPGASGQLIFNNGTSLAGDNELFYNATTNTLTTEKLIVPGNTQVATAGTLYVGTILNPKLKVDVAGTGETTIASATITGNLTVDTNTLFVDSANNKVGIGTTTIASTLTIRGTLQTNADYNLQSYYKDNGSTWLGYHLFRDDGPNYLTVLSAQPWAVLVNGSERFRIDTSGNVGIGVTPSAAQFPCIESQFGTFISRTSTNIANNAYYNSGAWKYIANGSSSLYFQNGNLHQWSVAPSGTAGTAITFTEAMTLDGSGNLLVGTTTNAGVRLDVQTTTGNCIGRVKSNAAASTASFIIDYVETLGCTYIKKAGSDVWIYGVQNDTSATPAFKINTASNVGVQLVSGATSWTTLSDETMKDIIEPISNAVAKVGSIRSVIGKFKTDDSSKRRSFLIAQDVQSVLPEAVDVVGENNELGLRYTEVIPLLVAAIKELTARVQTLEAK